MMRGQGATEYLILLAVVLIIALVGIALLGFFPGTASDAQATESQLYWRSATPIAINEWTASGTISPTGRSIPTFRIRNTGNYPITITKIIGSSPSNYISYIELFSTGSDVAMSSVLTLMPAEETYVGFPNGLGYREIDFVLGSTTSSGHYLYGATRACYPNAPYGTTEMRNFGFEYIQTVEGQQLTKRQIGTAPLVIKCGPPMW